MESLGETIRKLRKEQQLPLRTVAAHLDIDQAILSKIERGQRNAKREQVIELANYFGVEEKDLLVSWLSDKLVYELSSEEEALKALQAAEDKIKYLTYIDVDKKSIKEKIRNFLKNDGRISKARIFGSFARGEDDYKSDIDLMIEVPETTAFSLFDIADVQYHLELLVSKKIDIVMKGAVKENIKKRIEPDLKIIYER